MEIDLDQLIAGNEVLLTFLVLGTGYLLGNLSLGPVKPGPITGVLIAGLIFGHFGFTGSEIAGTLGFTLFIFCIGLYAGPRFFNAFAEDGLRYIAISLVVAVVAVTLALLLARVTGLAYGLEAGLLAGALTSTPTLAGAQEAILGGLATPPEGMTAAQAAQNVTVAYSITYIFGTFGLILLIRYAPILLGIDLVTEARKLAAAKGMAEDGSMPFCRPADSRLGPPLIRAYRITEGPVTEQTLGELLEKNGRKFTVLGVRRGNAVIYPLADFRLKPGDVASAIGRLSDHQLAQEYLGNEVLDRELLDYEIISRDIVITRPAAAGKTIADLNLTGQHGCFPLRIVRSGVTLPADEQSVLAKGDRLLMTGETNRLHQLADEIGYIEQEVEETDLLTFAFGMVGGLILGSLLVKVGNFTIGLGSAGGLLISGILLGFLRSQYPTFGGVPAPARFILMQLGLMLFMAGVGMRAGAGFVEAFLMAGPALIVSGMVLTIVPVICAYLFGRLVLKMNPVVLLGSITGAMTSTPALNIVTSAARSSLPALGYAGTYTFANVLLTFAGTLIVSLPV